MAEAEAQQGDRSRSERVVLRALAGNLEGLTTRQLAAETGLSEKDADQVANDLYDEHEINGRHDMVWSALDP